MTGAILSILPEAYPWKGHLQYVPSLNSTNDVLKSLARQGVPHGTAIIAGRQTGGKGRLGRSFHSPEGMGIYLSILLRPNCAPCQLMHLTCAVAVAMCNAVETVSGFRPGIKWTNDLVCGKLKLGGILTELGLSSYGSIEYAIIGIGINCRQQKGDFPEDIRDIAASVNMVTGNDIPPARLAAAMLEELWKMNAILLSEKESILEQYRRDCVTIGQKISVVRGGDARHGKALSVDNNGALMVQYDDGSRETVSSGEVSIRGMYGYV